MRNHYGLWLLCAVLVPSMAFAKDRYEVKIEAPPNLASLLADNLDIVRLKSDEELNTDVIQQMVDNTPASAQRLLETDGYFNSKVSVNWRDGENPTVLIHVTPGPVSTIHKVTVHYTGPVESNPLHGFWLNQAMSQWPLPEGSSFTQSAWDSAKKIVLAPLVRGQYPLAKLTASQATVNPEDQRVDLSITIASGPAISFGPIRVFGLERYPKSIVLGQADFQNGTSFSQLKLTEFQSNLEKDVHFSSAVVIPRFNQIVDDQVPIDVHVVEYPREKAEIGLSYGTGDGFGMRLGYEHYNIFKRGYTGSILYDWKQSEKNLSFGLGFPRRASGYSYAVNLTMKTKDVLHVENQSIDGGIWQIRQRDNIDSRLGLEYIFDAETVSGLEKNKNKAVLGTIGWTQRHLDSLMRPTAGYLLDGSVSSTLGKFLSDASFVRARVKASYYWSPKFMSGTIVTRGEVGQVWTNNVAKVPSSRLFQTGGASSVRGYEFNSLGVAGPNNSITGGQVLGVASLEYQYPVTPNWRAIMFHDMGNAAMSWHDFRLAKSVGVGALWFSPIAPIAMNVARADQDNKVRWHINLGLPF